MTVEDIAGTIGYCGLVCKLCGLCDGCKSENNRCGKQSSPEGCYQHDCCIGKGLAGCWECPGFPCDKDMFAAGNIRLKAFVRCAREDGVNKLAEYLLKNSENGIRYHRDNGLTGDYDGLESEDEVLVKLRTGKSDIDCVDKLDESGRDRSRL